ncbi:hypothetical protein BTO30_14985 [Domibacillus antri]|uniref:Uncharacterized protein n=1 Tax=Domibacillus antri TaxID=1714264 RepID=A0A1Q8Q262_9BACI|nr:zinc-finger-containing protein [Domibacillus antri]OLN21420.1 hypothetical protein BTO30_14985 [Domibacillus antri]
MICPYCQKEAGFLSSKEYYGTDYGTNLYVCRACDARVGTHKSSKRALGTMANATLRDLRKKCHLLFDRMWKSNEVSRSGAYIWLQGAMNLPSEKAHIGMFDEEQCKKLLHVLKEKRIADLKQKGREHADRLKISE